VYDSETRQRQTISKEQADFCVLETNYQEKLIFAAEFGENPTIRVFDSRLIEIKRLDNVCRLEILDMHYDHFKKNLYVVCGAPEYEVIVVNFENGNVINCSNDQRIEVGNDFVSFSISPDKNRWISLLEKQQLRLYKPLKSFATNNSSVISGLEYERVELRITDLVSEENPDVKFVSCFWDSNQNLFISTNTGKLYMYSVAKKSVIKDISLSSPALLITYIANDLMVLESNG